MNEIIEEYDPQYCHSLEMAYGEGMMSEAQGLDAMFSQFSIKGKTILDIGSGLGGVATYLAEEHAADVTGLEINLWMIEEATRRIPSRLKERLRFVQNTDNSQLPFEDHSFDVICSKGVLCHVEDKKDLFNECFRILKPGGFLVINDWLSDKQGQWGSYIQHLVELEGLSIHAETIDGYLEVLDQTNFKEVDVQNLSEQYAKYNEEIASGLESIEKKDAFIRSFGERLHREAIEGYLSIADAMRTGQGFVIQFVAQKPHKNKYSTG